MITYDAEDYYEPDMNAAAPEESEWKVFFDGGYWSKHGKGHPGKEISLNKSFLWGEEVWHIPAVYSCSKGLVVDFCVEITPEREKAFLDKWLPVCENDARLTREVQRELDKENPLVVNFSPHLFVNGEEIRAKHGSAINWIPESCIPEGTQNQREAKQLVEHYRLDPSRAWSFHRWSCMWGTIQRPAIKSLQVKLERQYETIDGVRFRNPCVGDVITFTHPISHTEHKLTVVEYEKQELSSKAFAHEEYEFPTYHTAMTYTLEPDLSNSKFQVQDCLENEQPKRRPKNPHEPHSTYDVCSIGIIGGADGPTALIFSNGSSKKTVPHVALSALHFEPVDDIEWKIIFREKLMEDVEVDIIS